MLLQRIGRLPYDACLSTILRKIQFGCQGKQPDNNPFFRDDAFI
jgi:hypothetical protein